MTTSNRRDFLRGLAAASGAGLTLTFPPSIRRALAIAPHRRTGTIEDVEHIVILMQENRSFDHYFGTLRGVRGFGDRFPIPVPDSPGITDKTVWVQPNEVAGATPPYVTPFHLNTVEHFELMRVTGTPHGWSDGQHAWGDGRLAEWPRFKHNHALGFFAASDIPFQFALAEAFTICDAYHCSIMSSTNPNRLFLWTGTNDPLALGGGPAMNNDFDNQYNDPAGGYTWTTYPERLEAAGISWQIYENMDDNFTDNSVAGFRSFRAAYFDEPGALATLKEKGLSTRDLDKLKDDVLANKLPQVTWVVATAEGSEHPGPSSPAQGADYTAKVLDALTSNPEVWSKTVLFVNFDENDGFFDHVPAPAAPAYVTFPDELAGGSTVDTTGEYHEHLTASEDPTLQHKPYGLGARVPMYVVSPWSQGGWVNSQVFDHTSVIRFIEKRFGVFEPNISAWRRAVCGDLTTAFNFADPDNSKFVAELPETTALADRARALPSTTTPPTPAPELPVQDIGTRFSRALPYELHVDASVERTHVELSFDNTGAVAAVFHVYDRKHLNRAPRRYTVEADKRLAGTWSTTEDGGAYDLWVLGPNGFHRHFVGDSSERGRRHSPAPEVFVRYDARRGEVSVKLRNDGHVHCTFKLAANAYFFGDEVEVHVGPQAEKEHHWSLRRSAHWYDFTAKVEQLPDFARRFAGRVETGRDSYSDPALGGRARGDR